MGKIKYYTNDNGYVSNLLKEELEKLQKEVDDRYSYKDFGVDRTGLDCYPEAYNTKKGDAMLIKYHLKFLIHLRDYPGSKERVPIFILKTQFRFIDIFLHQEDKYKNGYEKFNQCSLRPFRDPKSKEFTSVTYNMKNEEAYKFIFKKCQEIISRLKDKIMYEFNTQLMCELDTSPSYIYSEHGKPEQYKEYFCNIIRHDPYLKNHYKEVALKTYGLHLTDKDIENCNVIEDIYGLNDFNQNVSNKENKTNNVSSEENKTDNDNKKELDELYKKILKRANRKISFRKYDDFSSSSKKSKPNKNTNSKIAKTNVKSSEITLVDILLNLLPTLIMIVYVILLFSGVMSKIKIPVNFTGTLFGYHFELSNSALHWLENTHHEFFSAITLGFLQIILIVLGFILDLIIHLVFLILSILWVIITLILSFGLIYAIPIIIPIFLLINFIRVEKEKKLLVGICLLTSIICCLIYYINIAKLQ